VTTDVHWTDRVTQADHLRDATRQVQWGVWGAGVHGTAPMSITAVHCAAAIQYSLPAEISNGV